MHILGFKLKKCVLLFILLLCTTLTTYADDFDANETYYLYNVGAKKYLYVGNNNGTMASLLYSDLGTPLRIGNGPKDYSEIATDKDGYIEYDDDGNLVYKDTVLYRKITTPIFNTGKNALGLGTDSSFHLDRDDGSSNLWRIEKIGDSNYYTFRLFDKSDNKYHILRAEPDGGNITKVASVAQTSPFSLTRMAADLNLEDGKDVSYSIDGQDYTLNATAEEAVGSLDNSGNYLTGLNFFDDEIQWKTEDNDYDYDDVPNLVGKYDITVTYIPTEGVDSLGINVLETTVDGDELPCSNKYKIDEPVKNDEPGKDTESANAKTVHFSFYLSDAPWTTISVTIHGPIDHFEDTGEEDPKPVYKAMPNIVSYTISIDPGQPASEDTLQYARWQVVSKTELLNQLKDEQKFQNGQLYVYGGKGESKTDATLKEGNADVTFLMKDQGFTYGVDDAWNTNGASYTKNAIGNDSGNSMYWNAHITGKGQVYQDVDVPNVGVYQMDAYGFSHNCTTNMFYQYATKIDGSNITWSPVEATTAFTSSDKAYSGKQSDIDAGDAFYKESVLGENSTDYKRTLTFYVPLNAAKDADGNYKIRIGFDKTEQANDDYTAVDDVHLHYKGQSAFVLDGKWSEDEMTAAISDIQGSQNSDDIHVPVYIKRDFWGTAWNPIVLPIDVSNAQIKQTFGDKVYVSTPYGLEDKGIHGTFMRFTLLSDGKDLQAGKYYLIFPSSLESGVATLPYLQKGTTSENGGTYSLKGLDNNSKYYYLGTYNITDLANLSTAPSAMTKDSKNGMDEEFHSKVNDESEEEVNIVGGYHNITMNPNPYIFLSNSCLFNLTINSAPLDAFKFYIYDVGSTPLAKAAGFNGSLSIEKETTTGIQGISVVDDVNRNVTNGIVYNLSGERVGESGNFDRLPAGIYIVNGRKFIKK